MGDTSNFKLFVYLKFLLLGTAPPVWATRTKPPRRSPPVEYSYVVLREYCTGVVQYCTVDAAAATSEVEYARKHHDHRVGIQLLFCCCEKKHLMKKCFLARIRHTIRVNNEMHIQEYASGSINSRGFSSHALPAFNVCPLLRGNSHQPCVL